MTEEPVNYAMLSEDAIRDYRRDRDLERFLHRIASLYIQHSSQYVAKTGEHPASVDDWYD